MRRIRGIRETDIEIKHWKVIAGFVAIALIASLVLTSRGGSGSQDRTPVTALASVATPEVTAPLATTTSTTLDTPAPSPGVAPLTVPPGGALPSDAQCAAQVKNAREVRSGNASANHTRGAAQPATYGNWGSNAGAVADLKRVDGHYTGTTDEIIQWAACKWGFDPDVVRAQAMIESSWHQTSLGGFVPDTGACVSQSLRRAVSSTTSTTIAGVTATTNTTLVSGAAPTTTSTTLSNVTTTTTSTPDSGQLPGNTTTTQQAYECPTAFGLLQLRSDYQPGTYPMSAKSTAFNADYALAMERACYDGVSWFGSQTRGDLWGCVGAYFSGSWQDSAAHGYVASVQSALATKTWTQIR